MSLKEAPNNLNINSHFKIIKLFHNQLEKFQLAIILQIIVLRLVSYATKIINILIIQILSSKSSNVRYV